MEKGEKNRETAEREKPDPPVKAEKGVDRRKFIRQLSKLGGAVLGSFILLSLGTKAHAEDQCPNEEDPDYCKEHPRSDNCCTTPDAADVCDPLGYQSQGDICCATGDALDDCILANEEASDLCDATENDPQDYCPTGTGTYDHCCTDQDTSDHCPTGEDGATKDICCTYNDLADMCPTGSGSETGGPDRCAGSQQPADQEPCPAPDICNDVEEHDLCGGEEADYCVASGIWYSDECCSSSDAGDVCPQGYTGHQSYDKP